MGILHGSWLIQGDLLIWGETWRPILADEARQSDDVSDCPLGMTRVELREFLQDLQTQSQFNWSVSDDRIQPQLSWKSQVIALPTPIAEFSRDPGKRTKKQSPALLTVAPQHSATPLAGGDRPLYLYPWKVEGLCLNPQLAMQFLQALPLGAMNLEATWFGEDLRFWSHLSRWSLDLLARCKFLPRFEQREDGLGVSFWQPLLDSNVERSRLASFAKAMPASCRTYRENGNGALENELGIRIDLPVDPEALILSFLSCAIDVQLREVARGNSLPKTRSPIREWLQALTATSMRVDASTTQMKSLEAALNAWTVPVQHLLKGRQQFRTGVKLHPPTNKKRDWMLEYCLQAADNPEFIVDAATIWNNPVERLSYRGHSIERPQETLLSGLGLASRLYQPIEASLEQARPLFCRLTPAQAYEFIKSGVWRFQDSGLGVILPPSLANRETFASRLGLSIRAETPMLKKSERIGLQSLLNFQWELTIGGQRLSKAEFDKLVALNSPLVEINGEWVELRPQDVRAAENFFESRKDKLNLSLEDALRISTGDSQTIEKLPVVSFEASGSLQQLIANLTDNRSLEAIASPANFRGELRPYQARGAGWLAFLERWGLGACLADDMGLGKTIELIAFLLHLQEREMLEKPTLLVCPTSVLGNWEREVKRFAPTLKTLVHHGDKRARKTTFVKAVRDKDLVITSYALTFRDETDLQKVSWQGIVVDEAQMIKNPQSKQSQAVRKLEAEFKIALTGTPVENRLQEFWSIMDFLNPGYLGTRQFFQRRFAMPIEKYGDTDSLQTLRSLVQPFILRRLKTDRDIIQDLPEKQEMNVFCGLSLAQAELYQNAVDESLREIEESDGIQRHGKILALLTKLKQICNHPAQFLKQKSLANPQQSGKLMRLEEMLEELIDTGDRALIFTQFAEWGKLLQPYLETRLGGEVLFLYGSTRKQQREGMIDRFQNDPQAPKIMILSLKAGGVGLNLTRANHVFHFDRWWNPAVENQATDRAFRIGQTRNVQVHKFVCTGTLEERIHDLIESKKMLAEQVVGTGENWLTELDTDQLRDLLLLDRRAVMNEEKEEM